MQFSIDLSGPDFWWAWDINALIITFAVIQALVLVKSFLQNGELLPTFITRKAIHIFVAVL